MNPQQLRALFWLRWRVHVNQFNRAGWMSGALTIVLGWAIALLAAGLFVGSFCVGLLALGDASPEAMLYVWDAVVLNFVFFWTIGLMAELQRSDTLSLDKLLHLPLSPAGAFTVNYLSSLFCPSLLLFAPVMFGLCLGLAAARGPVMLPLLPAAAALLLMVSAVTHQFQGWLAAVMANKRRRRSVLFLITAVFLLVSQAPNLLVNRSIQSTDAPSAAQRMEIELQEVQRAFAAHEIDQEELERRNNRIIDQFDAVNQQEQKSFQQTVWLANLVFPPGWMPLSAMSAAEGREVPALLGTLILTMAGALSLWRSYRTTLRLYTGRFTAGQSQVAARLAKSGPSAQASAIADWVAARPAKSGEGPALILAEKNRLLEKRLPWLPEPVSAVAMSTFRSLTRAPEVKMIFLSPLLMAAILGPMLLRNPLPIEARPLLGFSAMAFILMFVGQLLTNQFGLDRSGFQVYVLSGTRRQDILLGKNLAVAPFALGMGLIAAIVVQMILPMRLDLFLAVVPQFVSMFFLFCLITNWLSVLAPVRIPAGTMRGAKPSLTAFVLQIVFTLVLFPLAMAPTLLPLGAELLLRRQGWISTAPVCLLLSGVVCVAAVCVYRLALSWQGNLLQERELKILETVRTKQE